MKQSPWILYFFPFQHANCMPECFSQYSPPLNRSKNQTELHEKTQLVAYTHTQNPHTKSVNFILYFYELFLMSQKWQRRNYRDKPFKYFDCTFDESSSGFMGKVGPRRYCLMWNGINATLGSVQVEMYNIPVNHNKGHEVDYSKIIADFLKAVRMECLT